MAVVMSMLTSVVVMISLICKSVSGGSRNIQSCLDGRVKLVQYPCLAAAACESSRPKRY
jgi:hypothetical protein